MTRIFISYSSKDRALVDELAADLEVLFDGVEVWYDRELNRSGGHQWWNLILERIRACDVFIYALSPHVLTSVPCQREYGYARDLGKPILPLRIDDVEFRYLPLELQKTQLVDFRQRTREQQKSLKASIRNLPPAPALPPNAEEIAPEAPIDPIGVLFDRIARLSAIVTEQRYLIVDIEDLKDDERFQKFIPELLERLVKRDDVLTARNLRLAQELQQRIQPVGTTFTASGAPDTQQNINQISGGTVIGMQINYNVPTETPPAKTTRKRTIDLLPAPFAWIEIPGKIGKKWKGAPFSIAKYPVTNAQFWLFSEAGGYRQKQWWTETGWKLRQQEKWTQPRFWTDKKWMGAEQPVVGVSWYEAVAFCLWLSDTTGEKIMLPMENQWQYAAQGDDGRDYPWGKNWDCEKCNNSVEPCNSNMTNPVRQYEGKGDSFFGAVDMAGNVWEWCLTDYNNKTNDMNSDAEYRVLRGGSWFNSNRSLFRCADRSKLNPHNGLNFRGFRIALS